MQSSPKIVGEYGSPHTWRTHPYKGIGRLPANLKGKSDPAKRILLDQLPRILAGYGKSLRGSDFAVVVVVDSDDRDCVEFKQELLRLLQKCSPRPRTLFRIAVEEIEAWLLGERAAILAEFPRAKAPALDAYEQDSVCGTWEKLADAVYPGGSSKLKSEGWPRIGEEKCRWASQIGRHIQLDSNRSPSLQAFRSGLLRLCGADE